MGNKKILLNDDMDLFVELEQTFFHRGEVDLLVARTGPQAREMVKDYRPDLVFLDLYMPEMDGDEVCRSIKQNPGLCATPLVLVVPERREENERRCSGAGCDAILYKPIHRNEFTATANRFLQLSERSAPRVPARLKVHYGSESPQLLSNYSVNISSGGLFLETEEPLPIETPLMLEFCLPNQVARIRCRGRVAWVNHPERPKRPSAPPGMGIQFLGLTLEGLYALQEFVKKEHLSPSW